MSSAAPDRLRLTCPACSAGFLVASGDRRLSVPCPKCGAQVDTAPPATRVAVETASSATTESTTEVPRSRRRWVPLAIVALLALVGGGGYALWTTWPRPKPAEPAPQDPVEIAATRYLEALKSNDAATVRGLSAGVEAPSVARFTRPRWVPGSRRSVKGPAEPLAALHARIERDYTYDSASRRFQPKNLLGPASELMDEAEALKKENEEKGTYDKIAGGTPYEQMDAAISLFEGISKVASKVASPERILPSYAQLVEKSDPPLPASARSLADDWAAEPAKWDALLGRPFHTLKGVGDFGWEQAVVRTRLTPRPGAEPAGPRIVDLTLARFQLDGIDTGWTVVGLSEVDEPASPSHASGSSAGPGPQSP